MLLRLLPLLIFLAVPVIEIALFIAVGERIGLWTTIGIVILTAVVGTTLLRMQGLAVLSQARADLESNRLPVAGIIDGVFLLVAAVLLLTPGFLTDTLGFLLFVPQIRRAIGRSIISWFKVHGTVRRHSAGAGPHSPDPNAPRSGPGRADGPLIDGDAIEIEND